MPFVSFDIKTLNLEAFVSFDNKTLNLEAFVHILITTIAISHFFAWGKTFVVKTQI